MGIINPAELSLSHRKDIRVALYLRVSTSRSVESNLSIPEQERQLRLCCEQMGWKVVAVYIEEGKSAKTTPGGKPPDGFKLVPSTQNPRRKVLAIDEDRRWVIDRIFTLALYGDGNSAPMGVKAITEWLSQRNILMRTGSRWGIQQVHTILTNPALTNPAYFGVLYWGVRPSISEFREELEPLLLKVPAIISREMYEEVQLRLKKRNPMTGAAKQISSPLLLSG